MIKKIIYLLAGFVVISMSVFLAVSVWVDSNGTEQEREVVMSYATTTVIVNDSAFIVDIADTKEKVIRGLSYREKIEQGTGMLFVFDRLDNHGIWMKGMNFSIDVLWLDDDGRVVYIIENMHPASYPNTSYRPQELARYVVELPSGTAQKNTVKLGDLVKIEAEKVE